MRLAFTARFHQLKSLMAIALNGFVERAELFLR